MPALNRDMDANSKESLRLWLRLYRIVARIECEIRSRFSREFGISLSRFDVMSALDRAEHGLSMGELCDCLIVSNGNVTGLISRLVNDDLVHREASKNDRRSFTVQLTSQGKDTFKDMALAHKTWVEEILGEMPDGIATDLLENLDTLMTYARLDASKD